MQFNLRALFVDQALLALAIVEFLTAFAWRSDALAMLFGTAIVGALLGAIGSAALRLRRSRDRFAAIGLATAAGLAVSFFIIQAEWRSDGPLQGHPWPQSDVLYVVIAVARCGILGGFIGYVVVVIRSLAAESRPEVGDRSRRPGRIQGAVTHGVAAAGVITILVVSWWPYWSFHQERRAVIALLHSIENGSPEQVRSRAADVNRFCDGNGAISSVAFLALHGQDEHVRLAALEGMKLIPAASAAPVLRPMLNEMLQREDDARIRAVAAAWLDALDR